MSNIAGFLKPEREAIEVAMADWFYKSGGRLLNSHEIVDQMNVERARSGLLPFDYEKMTYQSLYSVISDVRRELEMRYQTTLVCIRKKGWKIANSQEHAEFTMECVKRTMQSADRTARLFPGVDRKCIPSAMKAVFGESSRQVLELKHGAQRFILGFNEMRKLKERKELAYEKQTTGNES